MRRANSIHGVVTDPPFGVIEYLPDQLLKRRNGNGGIWRLPHAYGGYSRIPTPRFTVLGLTEHALIRAFHIRLAALLHKVLVPGAHAAVASQPILSHLTVAAFVEAGFEVRGQIVRVVKTLRGGDRPKNGHTQYPELSVAPRSCWEPWLLFRKPCEGLVVDNLRRWGTGALRRPSRDTPFMDLIQSLPARGEERAIASHPSLKPQAFLRQLVSAVLPLKRGILLDPFMGSGSTIAAATALRYRSIGIEIDRQYFKLAQSAIPKLARLPGTSQVNARDKRGPRPPSKIASAKKTSARRGKQTPAARRRPRPAARRVASRVARRVRPGGAPGP